MLVLTVAVMIAAAVVLVFRIRRLLKGEAVDERDIARADAPEPAGVGAGPGFAGRDR